MRTVGQMLRETRIQKNLSLEQIERETKIRLKFLDAIEHDEYGKLPSVSYAKGFVKNYAEYLGLNSRNVLAFFRRQTEEAPKSSLLPKGVAEPLNPTLFRLTPGRFIAILVACFLTVFVLYFGLQYIRLNHPPTLMIDAPKNNLVTTDERLELFGKTDPDATVTVNGTSVLVRTDGKFFDQLELISGKNTITIISTSRFNKTATKTIVVILQK